MTTVQSPSKRPSPSAFPGFPSKAPTALKLRDSCHACASSKLKCYKEKPTCSRCAKRGIICQYVATKRGGRKHDPKPSVDIGVASPTQTTAAPRATQTQDSQSSSSWFGPAFAISDTDPLPSPAITQQPSPQSSASGTSGTLFPNFLLPSDQSLSSILTGLTTEFDEFVTSPMSFSIPDASEHDSIGNAQILPTGINTSTSSSSTLFDPFPINDHSASELLGSSDFDCPSNNRASPVSDIRGHEDSHASDSSCFCFVRALSLMRELLPNHSTACKTANAQDLSKTTAQPPTIQDVIAKNEEIIEAVSTMLQCSCTQDVYLLTIMSLIVFKLLNWYAAAARPKPSSGSDQTNQQSTNSEQVVRDPARVGSYCLEGEDSARMAAQLVLGELHRVQQLVNKLSTKLRTQEAKDGRKPDVGDQSTDNESVLPLSKTMMDQLGNDLKRRLKSISLEIVEVLRRG